MNHNYLKKLIRYRRRLKNLPLLRRVRYIAQVIVNESLGKRGLYLLGPRLLELTLTHRCQCQCVHCYGKTDSYISQTHELTKAEVFSVIEQAAGIGCTEVCFTGGEPLLREDLDEFVRHAGKLSLVTKINTNGILLNRERVLQLKKAGLTWCSVSIDSPDPQIHDKLRRFNGCYEKAIEGLKELYAQGISTSITTYVKKKNLHRGELERIVKLGHELNVDTVRILFPVPMGGFKNDQSVVLNFEEREYVRRLLKDPIVTLESPFEKSRCKAAVTKMNILPDGDVTPCVFVPRAYGNVREDSLKETWKRMKEFDSLCKPNGKCPMCNEKFRNLLLNELSKPKP